MPTDTEAANSLKARRASILASASCKATAAPVMDAVLVPPSAWMTSQSMRRVRSPKRFMLTQARNDRPIRR